MNKEINIDIVRKARAAARGRAIVERFMIEHPESIFVKKVSSQEISKDEAYDMLKEFAKDPKTGVQRSDLLHLSLDYEISEAVNNQKPLSIIVFDIDHFKQVNTELTHLGADVVLRQVADLIRLHTRYSDDVLSADETAVIRWGGEEFVVILVEADESAAATVAERIRKVIAEELKNIRPNNSLVTVSGGVASWDKNIDQGWRDVIIRADKRLMAAKDQGRNRIISQD